WRAAFPAHRLFWGGPPSPPPPPPPFCGPRGPPQHHRPPPPPPAPPPPPTPPPLHPLDRGRGAHLQHPRRLPRRPASLHRGNHPAAQILRIRSRHPHLPASSCHQSRITTDI